MHMIRYTSDRQLTLEGFSLPFGGKLNPENRWIKWHKVIPWDEFAIRYYRTLASHQGRPAKNAGLVIGALIIKHKLTLSDEETVLQIQENPCLQYFVGFSSFQDKQPLAPSLFVEIRKRMEKDVFSAFEGIFDILMSCLTVSDRHLFLFLIDNNDSIGSFSMCIAGRMRCTKNENDAAMTELFPLSNLMYDR